MAKKKDKTVFMFDENDKSYECSECGEVFALDIFDRIIWAYCPVCGKEIDWASRFPIEEA